MNANNERDLDRLISASLRPPGAWQPDLRQGFARLHQRRIEQRASRRRWTAVAIATAAVCIPLSAFPVTRAFAQRCVSACVAESGIVRSLLLGAAPRLPLSDAPAARKAAPDFSLRDAAGHTVKLSDYRGKVVLLNFWATWCGPCKSEIPWFNDFQTAWRQRGFTTLGVAMDSDGWAVIKPFTEQQHVNYPVLLGDDEVARLYGGLDSLPLTLIIDRSGRIAAIHPGLSRRNEYERDIASVVNEH